MKKIKKQLSESIKNVVELIFIGSVVFVLVNIFLAQLLQVTGNSMLPNYHDGEQIIAEKVSIKFKDLERGEIVIFKHPEIPNRLVIKRVIGLPNEILMIQNSTVFINGEALEETYLDKNTVTEEQTIIETNEAFKIPDDSYILFGDNRKESIDSREWGTVKKEDIVGKALFVYYPLKNFRFVNL